MSDTPKLAAQLRTEFGKGAARRTRRAGQIPAVLYGHGTDPVHLALPGHDTMMATKVDNAVLEIDFDGKTQLALVKDVQKDPVHQIIEAVKTVAARKGLTLKVTEFSDYVVPNQALDAGELLQVYAATLPELLLRAQRGELTDAKTLTALLWLQQTSQGVWPLDWQHHPAD